MSSEPPTVAIVLNDDGTYNDRCWSYETGENFAMQGWKVVAIADDGPYTKEMAQVLYDGCLALYKDCFD